MESIPGLLRALEAERRAEEERHRDLCLIIRAHKSKETLLCAGGRWDFLERRWSQQEPERVHVCEVHEGQEPFIRWGAKWLVDFRNGHEIPDWVRTVRARVALAESGRRAGKTHALQLFQWAVAIDTPLVRGKPLVCWTIHVSHQEEEEYFDALKGDRAIVPPSWHRWRARLQRFELIHGSYVQMISSDNEKTTKRGKVDLAFINEAQKQRQPALVNLLYGVADRGGLALLAANPNDSLTGEWVKKFKEGIKTGTLPNAVSFYFDPSKNPFIDQQARSDVDDIVKIIDPKAYRRESLGEWLPVGDRVYYDFNPEKHVRPMPDLGDITREVTKRRLAAGFDWVAGHDPQGRPHMAGVIGKFFGTPDKPILWIYDEIIDDGHEDEFLDEVDVRGYTVRDCHWIVDASGQWQDGRHSRNGVHTVDYFKKRNWAWKPPEEKLTARGMYPGNPKPKSRRYGLSNKLIREGRLMIDPRCKWLIESLTECPFRKTAAGGEAHGAHSHITDALGYLQWFWTDKPRAISKGPAQRIETVSIPRKSPWG